MVRVGIVGDDADLLRRNILDNLEHADLFITSGGVSVGDYDMVKEVLADLGHIDFWKVNMRPGKPQAFGLIEGKPLRPAGQPGFGDGHLPNEQLVRPALKKMMGARDIFRPVLEAEVEEPMGAPPGGWSSSGWCCARRAAYSRYVPPAPRARASCDRWYWPRLGGAGRGSGRLEPGDRVRSSCSRWSRRPGTPRAFE